MAGSPATNKATYGKVVRGAILCTCAGMHVVQHAAATLGLYVQCSYVCGPLHAPAGMRCQVMPPAACMVHTRVHLLRRCRIVPARAVHARHAGAAQQVARVRCGRRGDGRGHEQPVRAGAAAAASRCVHAPPGTHAGERVLARGLTGHLSSSHGEGCYWMLLCRMMWWRLPRCPLVHGPR